MSRRIIIEIKDDSVSEEKALRYVTHVVSQGRISKTKGVPQYCFLTTFKGGIRVYAREKYKTKADSFVVSKSNDDE